jgi:hypothetical protein
MSVGSNDKHQSLSCSRIIVSGRVQTTGRICGISVSHGGGMKMTVFWNIVPCSLMEVD